MNRHTVTCPNGQILTRNSKTKKYSHCVVVWLEWSNKWSVVGFSSRFDIAQKLANQTKNIFNSGISSTDIYVQNYFKTKHGETMQCKILEVTTV